MEKKKANWGGKRQGAGRPTVGTEKRKRRSIFVSDKEFEKVKVYIAEIKKA